MECPHCVDNKNHQARYDPCDSAFVGEDGGDRTFCLETTKPMESEKSPHILLISSVAGTNIAIKSVNEHKTPNLRIKGLCTIQSICVYFFYVIPFAGATSPPVDIAVALLSDLTPGRVRPKEG